MRKVEELGMKEDLKIDPEKLNKELRDIPMLYFKYSQRCNTAKSKVKDYKKGLEECKSDLYLKIKSEETKKLTQKELEAAITLDEEVMQWERDLIEAENEYDDLLSFCMALNKKHEALREISMNLRKELLDV